MLRRFGKLIWKQPREIEVLNYSKHIVYQIYTNQGYIYCIQNKETDKIIVENTCKPSIDGKQDVHDLR